MPIRTDLTKTAKNSTKNKLAATALSVSVIIASMASNSALAQSNNDVPVISSQQLEESAQTREEVGTGVGVVLGAIVAGPLGAILTGVTGHFIAKHINANEEVDYLSHNLAEQQNTADLQIAQQQRLLEQKLLQVEQEYQSELMSLEQNYRSAKQIKAEQLLMSLQFSTGSSDIAPHYQEQVAVLAQLLNSDSNLSVDLSGYTDLQGEEDRNQQLSKARVETVKELLMAQGVAEDRIQSFAYGEDSPIVANHQDEVSFYDRRVVLQVKTNQSRTAKN